MLEGIARRRGPLVGVFADFCRMGACANAPRIPNPALDQLSETELEEIPIEQRTISIREDEYMSAVKRYDREELNEFSKALAWLQLEMADPRNEFTDILGPYYEEVSSKMAKKHGGEFYTPPTLSDLMARMIVDPDSVIEKGLPVTVQEPCSGAGGMILSLAKLFSPAARGEEGSYVDLLRVSAVDISPIACDMTYLNTTMWGIPAAVLQGNVLRDLSELTGWKNIHWYRVGEDERQQTEARVRMMVDFFKSAEAETDRSKHRKENPQAPLADITINREADQISFDFG